MWRADEGILRYCDGCCKSPFLHLPSGVSFWSEGCALLRWGLISCRAVNCPCMLGWANERMDKRAGAPKTYLEALEGVTTDLLRRLMRALSVPKPQPTRKADMVQAIAVRMDDDALLNAVWERLDALERMAVRETVHDDGIFDRTRFLAKYGSVPPGLATSTYGRTDGVGSDAVRLLFFPDSSYGPLRFLPNDLADRLRELAPPPPPVALRTTNELPETVAISVFGSEKESNKTAALTVRPMQQAAANDLRAVIRLIAAGAISVSAKTRRPSAATVRRIAEVLHGGDFYDPFATKRNRWDQVPGAIRAFAWPWLVQAAGLARLRGTRLELTRKGRQAQTVPAYVTLRHVWEKWCDSSLLDEFSRVDDIKGQTRGKGRRGMTAARDRRDVVVEALCACPVGAWVEFDDFGLFMRAASLDFQVTTDPWRLYLVDPEYGSLGIDDWAGWDIVEGRYLLCLLLEYAATLGMVDVAIIPPDGARDDFRRMWGTDELAYLSRYDGLIYFRLNSLGDYCLGLTEEYEPPSVSERTAMQVFADRRIVAAGTPSAEETAMLETFASPEADDTWRFDTERIVVALEEGGDVDAFRAFLAERDEQPLPETVEGFLDRLSKSAGALKMRGEAFLIECADADTAAALVADSRVAKTCLRAGERHLVVRAKSERAFRNAARSMGYGLRE